MRATAAEMPGACSRSCSAAFRTARAGAEVHQQRALAARADAGDLVERAGGEALGALGAVRADREAVGLVAEALQVEEQGRIGREADFAAARQVEGLAAGIAVRALGDADHGHVVDARFLQHRADRRELALAAVDQQQIRPFAARAVRILLLEPGEAAAEHLAHHREIVAGDGLGAA